MAKAGSMQRIIAGGVLDKECAMAIYPLYLHKVILKIGSSYVLYIAWYVTLDRALSQFI